jgi:hypothetical protein
MDALERASLNRKMKEIEKEINNKKEDIKNDLNEKDIINVLNKINDNFENLNKELNEIKKLLENKTFNTIISGQKIEETNNFKNKDYIPEINTSKSKIKSDDKKLKRSVSKENNVNDTINALNKLGEMGNEIFK